MRESEKRQINVFLENIAASLDISDAQMEKAKARYEAIGEWLGRENSNLYRYSPSMYPQGSFLLGTVIKPLSENDEYDVDLVCEVKISKAVNSQKALKDAVGAEVKAYNTANNFIKSAKEGKRCWTLEYAETATFHMDILPAVPDGAAMKACLESQGFDIKSYTDLAIAITDNTLPNYSIQDSNWPVSNPRGYAEWFQSRMEIQFIAGLEMLAEARKADVADIPAYQVKTPLQRTIQLLKRHRDIMFKDDFYNKPISIIITTLSALAYRNENNIQDALYNILSDMDTYIHSNNGVDFIYNPVNPTENFADKWNANPVLKKNFFRWLQKARNDFQSSYNLSDIQKLSACFESFLGQTPVYGALRMYEDAQHQTASKIIASITTPLRNVALWFSSKYNVHHRQQPKWIEKIYRSVLICAEIEVNGRWDAFSSDTHGLPKGCRLKFLATTDAVPPYNVHWQIVNTGYEATSKNALRGEFNCKTAGIGGLTHYEKTEYTGMHWVECFIIKNEMLIARSGPFEVNII